MKFVSPWYLVVFAAASAGIALGQSGPAPATSADARALEIGRAYQKFQEQLRAIHANASDTTPWWRTPYGTYTVPGTREKIAQANRDFNNATRGLLGTEPIPASGRDLRYSFLPEAKQLLVAQIDQTFAERTAELRREAPNVRLPADIEKSKQLTATRERELLAVLAPAEFEMVEMRTSQSSATVRQRFGEAIESEDEFRKVFILQKAFDEKYPIEDAIYSSRQQELMRQRSEAERKMMDEIRVVVGDERYVAYRRAMDTDFITARTIVRRLNLPETALEATMKIRENYATQSMTINAETGLNPMDRRALVQELAKEARKELTETLTKEGGDMYASRGQWMRYLEGGTAFSTNPKDSSSSISSSSQVVFPVYPGGMMISTSTTSSSAAPAPATSASKAGSTSTVRRSPAPVTPKAAPEKATPETPPPAPK